MTDYSDPAPFRLWRINISLPVSSFDSIFENGYNSSRIQGRMPFPFVFATRSPYRVLPNSHGYAQKSEDIKYLRFNTFNRNAYVSESGWYSAGWQIGRTPLPLEYLLFVFRFHPREFPWKERHFVFPDFPWNNTVETGEILREEWKTRCGSTCIFDGSG